MKINKSLCWIFLFITVLFVSGLTSCNSKNVEERNLQSKAKAESAYSKERKKLRWYSQCGYYIVENKNGQREEEFRGTYGCEAYCNGQNKFFPHHRRLIPVSPSLKVRLYSKSGKIIYEDTLKQYVSDPFPHTIDFEDPNLKAFYPLEGIAKLPEYKGTHEVYDYKIVRLDKNNKEIVLHERRISTSQYLGDKSIYEFDEKHECLIKPMSGPTLY